MGGVCSTCCGQRRKNNYEPLLLENEREAVADLLQYLESSPLAALTTLSFSDNVDLQRSAALAFAEITEKEVHEVGRDTLDPVLYLLTSHDSEVQRAASAALGNLAVNGLEPLIRQMLSPNVEVQCNAVGCVTNLATHGEFFCQEARAHALDENKTAIAKSGALVPLTRLAKSKDMRVQRNATGALLNMTHSEKYQVEIVKADGLKPLLRLLHSSYLPLVLSAAACVRNVSIHPANESPIIEAGFLQPLIGLLSFDENEEVQCHAISTLRNLAASSESNKGAIVEAGAVDRIQELVLQVPLAVQSEMTACVAVLALSDNLKPQLLEMGICEVLIPLTNSPSVEVQGNSAAALGNLSSKAAEDYAPFNAVWNKPDGGLHAYLVRFLSSADTTFQHIAVWTIVQLLEAKDPQLTSNIRNSTILISSIRQLADSAPSDSQPKLHSDDEFDEDGMFEDGEGEIYGLAKRILELVDGDGEDKQGAQQGEDGEEDHAALRASVHQALRGQ
ncbi:Vacuolar protein 8 [Trichosporon asahii var. asahii CBS 8904]|uniref:Vacuolar protein 8 n=1 Tax=Trichosporon asahii var. asahii (strain CBS 8904) TaxID=1220162 RepID=K1VJ85_TRIAC|nr:Vacuolar protein 8 [Trichosporon asahii var. asahii CBS 8904]